MRAPAPRHLSLCGTRPARAASRRLPALVATASALALAAAPAAVAHGGGAYSKYYLSEIGSIAPAIPGVTGRVLARDDQIELDNPSRQTFTVLGYENEPYLRFSPKGVEVNVHSPAEYLNDDRYAKVTLPKDASAKAAPSWKVVTLGSRWSWHDHRIHWMSTVLPPVAKAAPKVRHLVFDWAIPLRVEHAGRAATTTTIRGSLVYVPARGGTDAGLIIGIALPVGVVLLAGAATGFLVLRRRRLLAEARARVAAQAQARE